MNPLAMVEMKNKLKSFKIVDNSNKTSSTNNLNDLEDRLIKEIIQGEKKVAEGKSKNTIISLEEAVNKIRNSR